MHYCIQENVFRERNYDNLITQLIRLGLPYTIVKFDSNGNLINPEIETNNVFAFGSSKLARLATKLDWNPGSFFGGNHDYEVYGPVYGNLMLNHGCLIQNVLDPIKWYSGESKFIRPTKDSKVFNGGIYSKIKWDDLISRLSTLNHDINIQINKVKPIYKEVRIWVVNGKIVTSSHYKIGNNVMWIGDVDSSAIDFANSVLRVWSDLAPAFVIDLALTPYNWKIVEINCINCSAFYASDLQLIIGKLEERYSL